MDHLTFYNAGTEPARGRARLKVWLRRLFRKVLLPSSQRLVEILVSLCRRLDVAEHDLRACRAELDDLRRRHDDQAVKIPATIAFGWDYVAMVRRLAVLEEHVDTLMTARAVAEPSAGSSSVEVYGSRKNSA